jgi:hypothetical protein
MALSYRDANGNLVRVDSSSLPTDPIIIDQTVDATADGGVLISAPPINPIFQPVEKIPAPNPYTAPPIQCFAGEPYQLPDGTWACPSTFDDHPLDVTGGPISSNTTPPIFQPPADSPIVNSPSPISSTSNISLPATSPVQYETLNLDSAAAADQAETKILGMSPKVAIGVGIAAFFLLGSLGDETKSRKQK